MARKIEGLIISGGADKLLPPEQRAEVASIRGIQGSDMLHIAHWVADPETRRHLDFAPEPPMDWTDKGAVEVYLGQFENHYRNIGHDPKNPENPKKITPIVVINSLGEPISVSTIRWRGDPYVPKDRKIASIEGVIVDPELRHMHIGTQNVSAALDITFCISKVYSGEPAREVRAWVFTDDQAGDFSVNIKFFRQFGFENLGGNWREYASKREISNVGNRDAQWFKLTREKWTAMKLENPKLGKHAPIDSVNLRI